MTKRMTDEQRAKTVQKFETLKAAGKKIKDIERQLGVSNGALYDWQKKLKGKPGKTTSRSAAGADVSDALIYLTQAEQKIVEMVRQGKIARPDPAHLLTLLALGVLREATAKK